MNVICHLRMISLLLILWNMIMENYRRMREILPVAHSDKRFMAWISELDVGYCFSLYLTLTLACSHRGHAVCVHVAMLTHARVCPCSHSCHETSGLPRSPVCFQAIVCSLSISVRPAVDTSHFGNCWVYWTFLHGYRGRKISSSEKALRGFQTGWDKDWSIYTSRRCFTLSMDGCLCSVRVYTAAKVHYNNSSYVFSIIY